MENDWEADLKKLKNCVDYGTTYILSFDPSDFSRSIGRSIFKFIKKLVQAN